MPWWVPRQFSREHLFWGVKLPASKGRRPFVSSLRAAANANVSPANASRADAGPQRQHLCDLRHRPAAGQSQAPSLPETHNRAIWRHAAFPPALSCCSVTVFLSLGLQCGGADHIKALPPFPSKVPLPRALYQPVAREATMGSRVVGSHLPRGFGVKRSLVEGGSQQQGQEKANKRKGIQQPQEAGAKVGGTVCCPSAGWADASS